MAVSFLEVAGGSRSGELVRFLPDKSGLRECERTSLHEFHRTAA